MKFKVIKNKYIGTRLIGKDPEAWDKAIKTLSAIFDAPEFFEHLDKKEHKPKIKKIK